MFRKFMLFGLGGLAIAAALAYVSSASTVAGYEPAFARMVVMSDGGTVFGFDLAAASVKDMQETQARAVLRGSPTEPIILNRAYAPNIYSAAIAPTSVSGWRSGRVRTLAG